MKRTHTPIPPILCSNNHHPWRNSSTSTIVSSNNSSKNDNADNINACLKRIRISSTSPGELALNSDLAHLADEVSLYRTNQTTWFSSDHKLKLERDEVDALRLVLGVATDFGEEWTFHMQIPRMYPHQAPSIYRAMCKNVRTLEQRQLPDILVVLNNPAVPSSSSSSTIASNGQQLFAIYNGWSPVNRLRDLVAWLVTLVNIPNIQSQNGHTNTSIAQTQTAQSQQPHFIHNSLHIFDPIRFHVGFPTHQQAPKRSLSMSDIRITTNYEVNTKEKNIMDVTGTGTYNESSERFLTSCGSLAGAAHAGKYGANMDACQGQISNESNNFTTTNTASNAQSTSQFTPSNINMMDSS